MKRPLARAGLSLPELLIAVGIGSMVLATLVIGSVALQRSFGAAEYQIECQEDRMRVMDFLERDVRRASAEAVSNQNTKLTLTLPAYKKAGGAIGLPLPSLVQGVVHYGAQPVTVSYYIEGPSFMREEGGVKTVLSTHFEHFYADDTKPPSIAFSFYFTPRFSQSTHAAVQVGRVVCMRNRKEAVE